MADSIGAEATGEIFASHPNGALEPATGERAHFQDERDRAADLQPLQILHRALRGRYPLVLALGILIGTAGAVLGWIVPKPMFRSEGLIQIRYVQVVVDPSLTQTPFDVFMESQRTLIASRRVIDRALESPAWKTLGLPVSEQTHRQFASQLDVEARHGTEYLRISFSDFDPVVAARGVQAVTSAYAAVYREDEQQLKSARLKVLKQSRAEVSSQISNLQTEVDAVVKKYGSADLTALHDASVQRVTRLEAAIDDIDVSMAATTVPAVETEKPVKPPRSNRLSAITPEQIARTDGVMRTYLDEQRNCEQRLEVLKLRGFGENHPEVIFVRNTLEKATDRVQSYLQEYKTLQTPTSGADRPNDGSRIEVAKLSMMRAKARLEMVELGEAKVRQVIRDDQLRKAHEALETWNKKIDQLDDQDQMGGRLTVINAGEVPLSPILDRRLKFSVSCAAIGFALPIALFGLYGTFWRPFRYADETVGNSPAAPLLGIIPRLQSPPGEPGWDASQAACAAQQIHQIRIMLQTRRPEAQCTSDLITSATAGEGKTSLTMALGLSFAATGLRTLIIDSDLAGQQLSRGIDATNLAGLHEALQHGSIKGLLRRVSGVCVLPVGNARAFDACAISSASFKRLLSEARQYFDAILIDSGPVLASVEASVVAQEVDGVLFAISRGQEPPIVDRALRQLKSLGAKVCGLVFNRAKSADFYGSRSPSSGGGSEVPENAAENLPFSGRSRFGPHMYAVLSSHPRDRAPAIV